MGRQGNGRADGGGRRGLNNLAGSSRSARPNDVSPCASSYFQSYPAIRTDRRRGTERVNGSAQASGCGLGNSVSAGGHNRGVMPFECTRSRIRRFGAHVNGRQGEFDETATSICAATVVAGATARMAVASSGQTSDDPVPVRRVTESIFVRATLRVIPGGTQRSTCRSSSSRRSKPTWDSGWAAPCKSPCPSTCRCGRLYWRRPTGPCCH